ncbi:hypothetical protein D3C71_880760 [compost metagenome]
MTTLIQLHHLPGHDLEYTITSLGRSLQQPFEALYAWSMKYGPEIERAQKQYDKVQD